MSAKNPEERVMLSCVTGAGSATKITVTGMTVNDIVKSVTRLDTTPAAVSLTGLAYVDGGFKITASTSGQTLLVHWIDRSLG